MRPCGRCNSGGTLAVVHPRHRALCGHCAALLGASLSDEVRAGVDFHLAADPRGRVVAGIVGLLQEAAR